MSTSPLPAGLKFELVPSGLFSSESAAVEAINICDLLEVLIPGYWSMDGSERPDYETSRGLTTAWCKANGAHYYAEDREDFSLIEAASQAVQKGLLRVVYEDLS